jgi:hypothetical protein
LNATGELIIADGDDARFRCGPSERRGVAPEWTAGHVPPCRSSMEGIRRSETASSGSRSGGPRGDRLLRLRRKLAPRLVSCSAA